MERVPVSTILRIVHYTPVRSGLVCAVGLNFSYKNLRRSQIELAWDPVGRSGSLKPTRANVGLSASARPVVTDAEQSRFGPHQHRHGLPGKPPLQVETLPGTRA